MTLVQQRDGLEAAREITNRDWMIGAALSSTFHGRDIFSPVGGAPGAWRGLDAGVGPEAGCKQLVRLNLAASKLDERGLSGEVIATDGPFGNLVTDLSAAKSFSSWVIGHGQNVHVSLGKTEINVPFVHTFSDVALNKPLIYIDSRGHVGLAVNQGNFAQHYGIKPPVSIFIPRAEK